MYLLHFTAALFVSFFYTLDLLLAKEDNKLQNYELWLPKCHYPGRRHDMVLLLVLGTFLTFILLDWLLNRTKATQPVAAAAAPARTPAPRVVPEHVDGFLVPEKLAYHPGHSWLM